MILDFELNSNLIKNISLEEKKSREKSLKLFIKQGFPNKKLEEWKFTDLNKIIEENFKELKLNIPLNKKNPVLDLIKDFEHNYIILNNGVLKLKNFQHEDEKKIKIQNYSQDLLNKSEIKNPLINLNNALFEGGFYLEILDSYKFKKPLIIYNFFSEDLKNKITNNKNLIVLNDYSNLELIEFNSDISKGNFIQNNHTSIKLGKNSSLKNYTVQGCKSNGFFYKYINCALKKDSNYDDYIFSSGLKFNKIEIDLNIEGEHSNCNIQSALFLDSNSHQEIKTQINHLKPNCKSYQKIKNVLNESSNGAYQGKIFVKDIAQKTDAYQLSKALLLKDSSEFSAKPELEIYADDVKCSHGSTSGNMDEDSIYYLMTRGITRVNAVKLLTRAFLFEITNSVLNQDIKNFIEKNIERQIHGY